MGSSASPIRPGASEQRTRLPTQKKLHVLVAEDNAVNQAVARALLTKWGHTIRIAVNGKEAVELNRGETFDICLMDVSAERAL
jgi:CheY-like chemotaxis protein